MICEIRRRQAIMTFSVLNSHRIITIIVFSFLLCFLTGHLEAEDAGVSTGRFDAEGEKTGRDYSYYVPQGYDDAEEWPLVISVHPAGGTGSGEIRRWIKRAEKKHFIVVCPSCVVCRKRMNSMGDFFAAIRKDEKALDEMIEVITEKYSIDSQKVLLTGFSGGGFLVWYYGVRHPESITAIAPRSGNFTASPEKEDYMHGYFGPIDRTGLKKLAVYVVYGENDHPIALQAAKGIKRFFRRYNFREEEFEWVPDMGHQDKRIDEVIEWFFDTCSR